MKSLKEFITENLENPTIQTVQENTEKHVEENLSDKTLAENAEDEKTNAEKLNEQ